MINEYRAKKFCSKDISLIENYAQAVADQTQTWHCHHRKEIDEQKTRKQLIQENLYFNRPAEELIFLTKSEHHSLHNKGKNNPLFGKHHSPEARAKMSKPKSAEARANMSAAHKGKPLSPETKAKISAVLKSKPPFFGKHHSPEARAKLSAAFKGRHWWNNGQKCVQAKDCPGPEWKRGRV